MSDTPTVKIVLELDVVAGHGEGMRDALIKAIRTANDPCYRGPYWTQPVLDYKFRNPGDYIKLECNGVVRHVTDIEICPQHVGCSLVNKGHDDLYDQGFRHADLAEHGLKITPL